MRTNHGLECLACVMRKRLAGFIEIVRELIVKTLRVAIVPGASFGCLSRLS